MENYDKAMNLSTISANSAGSALEKFGIYQDSTQAKLTELTNQFQIFANNTIEGSVIKSVIDLGIVLMQFANTSVGQTIIKTTLLISTLALLSKGIGLVKSAMMKDTAGVLLSTLGKLIAGTTTFSGAITSLTGVMMASPLFAPAIAIAGIMALSSAMNHFTTSIDEQREIVQNHTNELSSLKSEYDTLMGKSDLTDIESARLKLIQQQIFAKKELLALEAQQLYEMSKPRADVYNMSKAEMAALQMGLGDIVRDYQELQNEVGKTAQAEYDRQVKLVQLSETMANSAQELLNLKEAGASLTAEDEKLLAVVLKLSEAQTKKTETTVEVRDSYAVAQGAVSDYISELEYLNSVEASVRDGGSLSLQQKDELIKKYPQLTNEVIRTSDGWRIEAGSLETLRQQSLKTAKDKMSAEKADLENRKQSLLAKLNLDKLEIKSAQQVADAMFKKAMKTPGFRGSSQGFGPPEMQQLMSLYGEIAEIDALIGQIGGIGTGRIGGGKVGGGASPKAKSGSSEDKWKKDFETQYKLLQHQLAMNIITETQYLDKLDVLYKKYFANKAKYTEDFMKYEEEVYTKRKKIEEDLLKERLELQKKSLESQKDALNSLVDQTLTIIKYEAELEKQKYNDLIALEKEKHNNTISNLQDEVGRKKKAVETELEGYRRIIQAQLESLRIKESERDFNKDISEKQKELSKLQSELLEVSFDDTAEGRARRLQLEEQIAKQTNEISEMQHDRGVELQEQALNKELEKYEQNAKDKLDKYDEYLDREEKRYEESLDYRIKEYEGHVRDIDSYLKKEGLLRQDARKKIEEGDKTLFDKLLEYNLIYGDGTKQSFVDIWETASQALDKYANKQLSVLEILAQLDSDITGIDLTLSGKGSTEKQLSARGKEQLNQQKYLHDMMLRAKNEGNSGLQKWIVAERAKWGMDSNGKVIKQYHDGGIVDGKQPLKSTEIVAKLLKGELVTTEYQADNFVKNILPKMLGVNGFGGENGDINVEIPIQVLGDLDKSVLPDIESMIKKTLGELNSAMFKRGNTRNARAYSI